VTKELAKNKTKEKEKAAEAKPAAEEKVKMAKKLQTNSSSNVTDKAIFDKFWYPKASKFDTN
jgi:hypothetical protein